MRVKAIRGFAIVLVVLVVGALGFMGYQMASMIIADAMGNPAKAEVVGTAPYDAFEGFESFIAGESAFDVGVNIYGDIVFLDRKAALKSTKVKCKESIDEMRNQASSLGSFRAGNMHGYYNYFAQINWYYADAKVKRQSEFLIRFLTYYENGNPHDGEV